MSLSPNYNPKQTEAGIYKLWQDAKIGTPELQNNVKSNAHSHYLGSPHKAGEGSEELTIQETGVSSSAKTNSKTHSILMPPPNLTGNLHAGHAFGHYVQDTLSRLARQRGDTDLWFPGVDHAGLQLEGVIDKLIKKGEFDELLKKSHYLGSPHKAGEGDEGVATQDIRVFSAGEEIFRFAQDNNLVDNIAGVTKEDLPKFLKANTPDLWLECAWSKVNLWRDNQKEQSAILGDTPDYERSLFTLDDKNIDMVNYAFIKYWQDGLIYKGSYLVNWSVGLGTALSDVAGEIEYEKRIDPFVTFEYRLFSKNNPLSQPLPQVEEKINYLNSPYLGSTDEVEEGSLASKSNPSQQVDSPLISGNSNYKPLHKSVLVSTVRPETIFGDYAVAVHPEVFAKEYSEFQELLGKKELFVQIPLTDRLIPVILADEVDPNFGSGALKITPAHDIVDYEIFNKYIGGDFEQAIGRDGKLTSLCGKYSGLTVLEGRKATIKDMVEQGFVPKKLTNDKERKESKNYFDITFDENIDAEDYEINWNYEHNVTVCERSKTVVEPLISEEFFVGWNTEFSWNPIAQTNTQTLAKSGQKTTLAKLGKTAVNKTNFHSSEYKERGINFLDNIKDWCISRDLIWGHKMPVWYNLETNIERKFWSFEEMKRLNSSLDGVFLQNQYFAISTTKPNTKGNWVQEEKILDTWFSSCLWPLSTLDYAKFVKSKAIKPNLIHIHGGEVWQNSTIYRSKIQNGELNSYWYSNTFDKAISCDKVSWKNVVASFCKDNYIDILKPQMPNKTNANYDEWEKVFEQSLPFVTDQTVLVGHSLGSMFLTKYLSENKLDCKAIFLVSGGLWSDEETEINDFDPKWGLSTNSNDFEAGVEILNSYGNKINIVHSKDDHAVEFARSVNLKSKLPDANFLELDGLGHLSGECKQLANLIQKQLIEQLEFVLIHGSPSVPKANMSQKNWFGWLKNYLFIKGYSVKNPELSCSHLPVYEVWRKDFEAQVSLNSNSVVVAHSAGGAFIVRYLSENLISIKKLILLSPSLAKTEDNTRLEDLLDFEISPKIKELGIEIVICTSDNEPQYRHDNVNNYLKIIGGIPKIFDGLGHFCKSDMGRIEFPEILELLPINQTTDFEKFYPTQEMVTGKDIFYQWIVRMTTLGYYFTAEIPYTDLVITPTVLDDKGKKMSKSLGNGMDPVAQIDKYSSDALRMALLGGMIPDRNMKMGGRIADELCEKYRNFGNKLWNVARFFEYQEEKNREEE